MLHILFLVALWPVVAIGGGLVLLVAARAVVGASSVIRRLAQAVSASERVAAARRRREAAEHPIRTRLQHVGYVLVISAGVASFAAAAMWPPRSTVTHASACAPPFECAGMRYEAPVGARVTHGVGH